MTKLTASDGATPACHNSSMGITPASTMYMTRTVYDITNLVIVSFECADDLLELITDVQPAGAKQSVLFDMSKPAQTPLSSLKSLATRQKAEFRQAQNDYRLAVSCAAGALLPQDRKL
jgi:hypothetical protein